MDLVVVIVPWCVSISSFTKLCTLNLYIFFCVNNTSINDYFFKEKRKFPILASESIQGWCNANFSILVKLILLKFPDSCPFLGFIHSSKVAALKFLYSPILAGCAHRSGLSLLIIFPQLLSSLWLPPHFVPSPASNHSMWVYLDFFGVDLIISLCMCVHANIHTSTHMHRYVFMCSLHVCVYMCLEFRGLLWVSFFRNFSSYFDRGSFGFD